MRMNNKYEKVYLHEADFLICGHFLLPSWLQKSDGKNGGIFFDIHFFLI